jgi:hypothetical protein
MEAIVRVESGGDPLAIGDNTVGRSYHPRNRVSAESLARQLLAAGHSIDAGIAQIDSMNFAGFGANVRTIFDPCVNLSIGSKILGNDYAFAANRYRDTQVALRHAIGMYNTGQLNAGARYIVRVLAAAGIRDHDALGSPIVAKRDPIASSSLVSLRKGLRKLRTAHREQLTPARAPILVWGDSRIVVF